MIAEEEGGRQWLSVAAHGFTSQWGTASEGTQGVAVWRLCLSGKMWCSVFVYLRLILVVLFLLKKKKEQIFTRLRQRQCLWKLSTGCIHVDWSWLLWSTLPHPPTLSHVLILVLFSDSNISHVIVKFANFKVQSRERCFVSCQRFSEETSQD